MTKSSLFSFLSIGNLGAEENIRNQELSMVSQELFNEKTVKRTEKALYGRNQGAYQPFLTFLLFFVVIRNSLWILDISAMSCLRSFPSFTHLATSLRNSFGTYKVQVLFFSFHVRRAISCIGPSLAHLHAGLPQRFMVMDSEACINGLIFRMRWRMCLPSLFVFNSIL